MKLIRNKIALTPTRPRDRSVILVNLDTQKQLVFDKILEEAHELFNAKTDTDILEELGDLEDIIAHFKVVHNISEADLVSSRKAKAELKGTFDGGYALL